MTFAKMAVIGQYLSLTARSEALLDDLHVLLL